jgi:hypothetical protein
LAIKLIISQKEIKKGPAQHHPIATTATIATIATAMTVATIAATRVAATTTTATITTAATTNEKEENPLKKGAEASYQEQKSH